MVFFETWSYPEDSDKLSKILLQDDKKRVAVGVIGKSPPSNCNKMVGLNVVNSDITLHPEHECKEGQIRIYYGASDVIYLHFETTYDECCVRDAIIKEMTNTEPSRNLIINKFVRNRFARMLLFATQVCHIIVYVELSVNFDPSLIPILKSLNIIREKHLKFLSKLLKNPNPNSYPAKSIRNGSPRCLFYFENFPDGYDKSEDSISKLEFEIEDNIYRLFRNELAFPNKSGMPLLTLPGNKRFVYFNTNKKKKDNLLPKSLNDLQHEFNKIIAKDNSVIRNCLEDLRPFEDFGKPLGQNDDMPLRVDEKRITFDKFLKDHITEALQVGFDDCGLRFKGKHINKISSIRTWYDTFKQMYKILIEDPDDPDFKPLDSGYKSYLENFEKLMDMDEGFYSKCCEIGIKRASNIYSEPVLSHYGKSFQKGLVDDALAVYLNYARGPNVFKNEQKLIKSYEKFWNNDKQCNETSKVQRNVSQKEKKHRRDNLNGFGKNVFASTCNCERAQIGREDLYTVRQENYEFIKTLQSSCIFCVNYNKNNVAL